MNKEGLQGLRKQPKLDLHCHLDGSLPVDYVIHILSQAGIRSDKTGQPVTKEDLVVPENCPDLATYLEKFHLPLLCMQTYDGLKRSSYEFLRGVSEEGCDYVEVRFAPLLSVKEHLTCRQVIEAVLEGLEAGSRDFKVDYGVIVCAMRHHTEEQNIEMIRCAREFLGNGVVAADLAGNEAAYPMHQFVRVFTTANQLAMPYTIHAGECGNVDNIREAVELGARRIGHGIAMSGHLDVQQLCVDKGIGVEMCPISNLQTKAVTDVSAYPLKEFLDNGVQVTVNTDNRTVSNTTIAQEMAWVKEHCGVEEEIQKQLVENAIRVSFASDEIKQKLWKKL